MSFRSPIHVLYGKDLSQLSEENLKMWRKELMLRFDLEGKTTIHLGQNEFDRNSIIEAFEALKTDTDFQIRLYKNNGLLDFLEKGQVHFFKEFYYWEDFKDVKFWNWIGPKFISSLQEALYKYVSNHNVYFIENLKTITRSGFQLSNADKDEAYSKAYHYLEHLISEGRKKYETPFYGTKPRKVKKEVKNYINESTFLILKNLPTEFNALKTNYGNFAHNVVYDALHKQTLLTNFKKDALQFIKLALQIDIEFRNDSQAKELIQHVETVLKGGSHPREGCAPGITSVPMFLILVVVALLRFGIAAERCNRTNHNSYDHLPQIDYRQYIPIQYDTSDFVGTWQTRYPQSSAGDNISYQKRLTFFNDSLGVMTFNFPTGKGNKECTITNFFLWRFQEFSGAYRQSNIELRYTVQNIKNGDSTDLASRNRVVLEKLKTKLSSKIEAINLQTFPLFEDRRNVKSAKPRGYIYTETPKIILDYYKRNKPKEFQKFQEISRANLAKAYIIEQFKSERRNDDQYKIKVIPDDYLVTFQYSTLKLDTIGSIQFRKGKPYLNPSKWYVLGDPCSVSGKLKDIRYLNTKQKPDKGDLELCFHYNEGFFLRESIPNLPEITVKPN